MKYTRALVFGFFLGLITTLVIGRVTPLLRLNFNIQMHRVGIIGDYTPSNLPDLIQDKISMGLTKIAPDGTAIPGLAQTWDATDSGKVYTFNLRKDIYWPNGKEVVAADVNYNIKDVKFTAINKNTLKAELPCTEKLCGFAPFPILVSKAIIGEGLKGFGAYRVTALKLKGDMIDTIKLSPNESKQPAYEYHFYRNESQAVMGFKLGEIDEISDLYDPKLFDNYKKIKIDSKVNYGRVVTVFFNLKNAALKDKVLRQSLAYAIPKLDGVEKAYSPIPPNSWAYYDKVKRYNTDLLQAKKLLDTTNISTNSAEIVVSTFSPYINVTQKIIDSWKSLGLKVTMKVENFLPSDYQIIISAMDIPVDPDQYALWHSTQTRTNITGYVNVKIDKLLEDGRQELDFDKRKKLYQDFQRYLIEDLPVIFLYYPNSYFVSRTN